jgi:hypothetical protein
VLLGGTFDGDRCAETVSRVVKLGHRLADLIAESRFVLTEVLDVSLIKDEPCTEGNSRAFRRSEVSAQRTKRIAGIGDPSAWY